MPDLREVLCPKCTYPGGLKIFTEFYSPDDFNLGGLVVRAIPVMSCSLDGCNLVLMGEIQGDLAVFPDPHVQPRR